MRVATVEGVPLCVPCGGQRLSAQTAAGESEWRSPSVEGVDVTRRALGRRTCICAGRARSVCFAGRGAAGACAGRPVGDQGASKCAPRLCAAPVASAVSPVRRSGLVRCGFSMLFRIRNVLCARRTSVRIGHLWTSADSAHVHTVSQFRRQFRRAGPPALTHIHKSHPPACGTPLQRTVNPREILTSLTWLLSEG